MNDHIKLTVEDFDGNTDQHQDRVTDANMALDSLEFCE